MNKNTSSSFQNDNRFICKLFGNYDHDFVDIDSNERILTIKKTKYDTYEKKGSITNWTFELDQIYNIDITPDEIYENEINCTDFLGSFSSGIKRTIVFVGEANDHIKMEPYITIIKNSLNDFLVIPEDNVLKKKNQLVTISACEISQYSIEDLLLYKESDDTGSKKAKIIKSEDEIIISNLSQVQIEHFEAIDSIIEAINTGKESKSKTKQKTFNVYNTSSEKKQLNNSSQLISIKLYDSETNACLSKVNFFLYRAYKKNHQIDLLNSNERKPPYTLYSKDNHYFFRAIHHPESSRTSYIMNYIKDTYATGKNLFIFNIPIDQEYIVLIHDLLNNIKMRKLTCQNFFLGEDDIADRINTACLTDSIDNKKNISFSGNNMSAVNDTTLADSFITTTKSNSNKGKINMERLKLITNKPQIMELFKRLDDI